jgi:hypothetical protein
VQERAQYGTGMLLTDGSKKQCGPGRVGKGSGIWNPRAYLHGMNFDAADCRMLYITDLNSNANGIDTVLIVTAVTMWGFYNLVQVNRRFGCRASQRMKMNGSVSVKRY